MATPSSSTLALVAMLLFYFTFSVTCQGVAQTQADRADQKMQDLYDTIKAVAFPQSDQLTNAKTMGDTRFILLTPGKPLNFFDYFPGEEYLKFIQEPDANQKYQVVPPHVMEKWFDLADVVPSANPYNGQDTGRSLANIYHSILRETRIRTIDQQGEAVLSLYNQALDYLIEVVEHPEDLTRNTTRLALYNEYKELYNKRKLEMEDKIEDKRIKLAYIDYELWFQRHYPSLLSKVESAYIRWLIFGQKEKCEIFITILDTGSSAKQLEEARIIMRSAGVSSLDRTRTIYPVSFDPSNWYNYLLPESEGPTRAELLSLLGDIQSKLVYTNQEISVYRKDDKQYDGYQKQLFNINTNSSALLERAVSTFVQSELECSAQNRGIPTVKDSCKSMLSNLDAVQRIMNDRAEAVTNYGDYIWGDKQKYIKLLYRRKNDLEKQKRMVKTKLGEYDPLVGNIISSDPQLVSNVLDSNREDGWMQFEYNSDEMESSKSRAYSRTVSNLNTKRRSGNLWVRTTTTTNTKTNRVRKRLEKEMAEASIKIKGKLLRVHIKRPWFKPEVFDDRNLDFASNTDTGSNQKVLGSPGYSMTEENFVDLASGGDDPNRIIYRLPEYVTSFLLAKEIELEISSKYEDFFHTFMKDVKTSKTTTNLYVFGFIKAASSSEETTSKNEEAKTRFYRTATGTKITVPGAQIIGYYTKVLPKFPAVTP